jgi:hypothetical protein
MQGWGDAVCRKAVTSLCMLGAVNFYIGTLPNAAYVQTCLGTGVIFTV